MSSAALGVRRDVFSSSDSGSAIALSRTHGRARRGSWLATRTAQPAAVVVQGWAKVTGARGSVIDSRSGRRAVSGTLPGPQPHEICVTALPTIHSSRCSM